MRLAKPTTLKMMYNCSGKHAMAISHLSEVNPDKKAAFSFKEWNINFTESIASHLVSISESLLVCWYKDGV